MPVSAYDGSQRRRAINDGSMSTPTSSTGASRSLSTGNATPRPHPTSNTPATRKPQRSKHQRNFDAF